MRGYYAWFEIMSVTNLARQGARDGKQSDNLRVIGKSKILNVTVETLGFLFLA